MVKAQKPGLQHERRASDASEDPDAELTERLLSEFPSLDSEAIRAHLALGRAFYRSIRAMEGYVLPDGTPFSRSKTNFLALLYLAEDHQLTVGAIARELGLSPASATRLLDSFEDDGLMVRVPSVSDRRITYARLTDAGTAQCQTALPRFLQFVEDIASSLSHDERHEMARLLNKYETGALSMTRRRPEG